MPYCDEEKSLNQYEEAFEMESKLLVQTNGLAKANAELKSLFDKAESTTYNNIIVHLNKILTLHSMLKSDRLQYYTELFSIHKERHSNSRRIARGGTPEMCAAVNTLKNDIVCCGMPNWPAENACCINDCHETCYRASVSGLCCIVQSPWIVLATIAGAPFALMAEAVNVVLRCFTCCGVTTPKMLVDRRRVKPIEPSPEPSPKKYKHVEPSLKASPINYKHFVPTPQPSPCRGTIDDLVTDSDDEEYSESHTEVKRLFGKYNPPPPITLLTDDQQNEINTSPESSPVRVLRPENESPRKLSLMMSPRAYDPNEHREYTTEEEIAFRAYVLLNAKTRILIDYSIMNEETVDQDLAYSFFKEFKKFAKKVPIDASEKKDVQKMVELIKCKGEMQFSNEKNGLTKVADSLRELQKNYSLSSDQLMASGTVFRIIMVEYISYRFGEVYLSWRTAKKELIESTELAIVALNNALEIIKMTKEEKENQFEQTKIEIEMIIKYLAEIKKILNEMHKIVIIEGSKCTDLDIVTIYIFNSLSCAEAEVDEMQKLVEKIDKDHKTKTTVELLKETAKLVTMATGPKVENGYNTFNHRTIRPSDRMRVTA
uniref:Uncharacterized protein n=1 Tax=Globodera rostochiensis TaxID=31243 RepID=A0A914H5Z0_GLORO